jgi:hypothetical protein
MCVASVVRLVFPRPLTGTLHTGTSSGSPSSFPQCPPPPISNFRWYYLLPPYRLGVRSDRFSPNWQKKLGYSTVNANLLAVPKCVFSIVNLLLLTILSEVVNSRSWVVSPALLISAFSNTHFLPFLSFQAAIQNFWYLVRLTSSYVLSTRQLTPSLSLNSPSSFACEFSSTPQTGLITLFRPSYLLPLLSQADSALPLSLEPFSSRSRSLMVRFSRLSGDLSSSLLLTFPTPYSHPGRLVLSQCRLCSHSHCLRLRVRFLPSSHPLPAFSHLLSHRTSSRPPPSATIWRHSYQALQEAMSTTQTIRRPTTPKETAPFLRWSFSTWSSPVRPAPSSFHSLALTRTSARRPPRLLLLQGSQRLEGEEVERSHKGGTGELSVSLCFSILSLPLTPSSPQTFRRRRTQERSVSTSGLRTERRLEARRRGRRGNDENFG